MCYSANASLLALATGLFFSGWMVTWENTSYQVIGLFIAFVSLMQGIEYLLWKHPICDDYHKSLSITGMILNHSQPIVLAGLLLLYNPSTPNRNLIVSLALVYLVLIIPYSAQLLTDEALQCTVMARCDDPHLVWNWNNLPYHTPMYLVYLALFLALPILGLQDKKVGYIFAFLTVISYGTSTILYNRDVLGSLWCFYTALAPSLLVVAKGLGFLQV